MRKRNRWLTGLCVALGLVLAALAGVTGYARYLLGRVSYVEPETVATLSPGEVEAILGADPETVSPDYTGEAMKDEDVELGTAGVEIGLEDTIINILLIGADYQGTSHPRADTIILATFNTDTKKLTMTSFMRDLYVSIPGYHRNKLNASYSLGGMNLLAQTLNTNFGVHVDGAVEVDFQQFQRIIDLLGGVRLELTEAEARWINKRTEGSLRAGQQLLTGEQAVWYARNRSDSQGDFNRTSRQRKLLSSLVEAYRNAGLGTVLSLMDEVLPLITTNLTKEQISEYVLALFPLLTETEMTTQRIPIDDGYSAARIDHMAVLVPDIEKNVRFLLDTIGKDPQ